MIIKRKRRQAPVDTNLSFSNLSIYYFFAFILMFKLNTEYRFLVSNQSKIINLNVSKGLFPRNKDRHSDDYMRGRGHSIPHLLSASQQENR